MAEYECRLTPGESFEFHTEWQCTAEVRKSYGYLRLARENFGDLRLAKDFLVILSRSADSFSVPDEAATSENVES